MTARAGPRTAARAAATRAATATPGATRAAAPSRTAARGAAATRSAARTTAERRRARTILARLAKAYPDWGPTLTFRSPFELLVATILAAQARDDHINQVTPRLFAKYPGPADFVHADQEELERSIKETGFFRQKAKALKAAAEGLLEEFGGEVPRDIDALVRLRGVGRKTASIVVGAAYGVPAIGVDRHVERTSQRLGLTRQKEGDRIELDLRALFPPRDWVKATWCLILHGRRICTPRPRCPECPVRDLCPYPKKTL